MLYRLMIKHTILCITSLVLLSCGEKDQVRLGKTDYYYVELGKYDRFITRKPDLDVIVIPNIVLGYTDFSKGVVVVRQVSNSRDCADGSSTTDVLNEFEIWIIESDSLNIHPEPLHLWETTIREKYKVSDVELKKLKSFVAEKLSASIPYRVSSKCEANVK